MSSDLLYVEFQDGLRLWGIYYGTSDSILPRLFPIQADAENAYRLRGDIRFHAMQVQDDIRQRAEATAEQVRFFTSYGVLDGSFQELPWNGHASRVEMVVIGPTNQEDSEWDDGRWEWTDNTATKITS